jgi:hypothetical protein
LRFSHPIVAARPAKPAMENQSRATVFGADAGNHFIVASWAVATASGIIVTSQRRSLARSKSVRGAVRSDRLCLDLSHAHSLQAGARKCLSGNDSPGVKVVDYFYMRSRTRNSQLFHQIAKLQSSNFQDSASVMSASGSEADMCTANNHVRFASNSDRKSGHRTSAAAVSILFRQ